MAVHMLFRPAANSGTNTITTTTTTTSSSHDGNAASSSSASPVRRSARLVPHPPTTPTGATAHAIPSSSSPSSSPARGATSPFPSSPASAKAKGKASSKSVLQPSQSDEHDPRSPSQSQSQPQPPTSPAGAVQHATRTRKQALLSSSSTSSSTPIPTTTPTPTPKVKTSLSTALTAAATSSPTPAPVYNTRKRSRPSDPTPLPSTSSLTSTPILAPQRHLRFQEPEASSSSLASSSSFPHVSVKGKGKATTLLTEATTTATTATKHRRSRSAPEALGVSLVGQDIDIEEGAGGERSKRATKRQKLEKSVEVENDAQKEDPMATDVPTTTTTITRRSSRRLSQGSPAQDTSTSPNPSLRSLTVPIPTMSLIPKLIRGIVKSSSAPTPAPPISTVYSGSGMSDMSELSSLTSDSYSADGGEDARTVDGEASSSSSTTISSAPSSSASSTTLTAASKAAVSIPAESEAGAGAGEELKAKAGDDVVVVSLSALPPPVHVTRAVKRKSLELGSGLEGVAGQKEKDVEVKDGREDENEDDSCPRALKKMKTSHIVTPFILTRSAKSKELEGAKTEDAEKDGKSRKVAKVKAKTNIVNAKVAAKPVKAKTKGKKELKKSEEISKSAVASEEVLEVPLNPVELRISTPRVVSLRPRTRGQTVSPISPPDEKTVETKKADDPKPSDKVTNVNDVKPASADDVKEKDKLTESSSLKAVQPSPSAVCKPLSLSLSVAGKLPSRAPSSSPPTSPLSGLRPALPSPLPSFPHPTLNLTHPHPHVHSPLTPLSNLTPSSVSSSSSSTASGSTTPSVAGSSSNTQPPANNATGPANGNNGASSLPSSPLLENGTATTSTTTPPSSPPTFSHQYQQQHQHQRTSPPLDAVDLGPLDALGLPGALISSNFGINPSGGQSPTKSQSQSRNASPVPSPMSSPPLSPVPTLSMGLGVMPFMALSGSGSGGADQSHSHSAQIGGQASGSSSYPQGVAQQQQQQQTPPSPTTLLFSTPISLPSLPNLPPSFMSPFGTCSSSGSSSPIQPFSSQREDSDRMPQQQPFLQSSSHSPTFAQPLGGLDVRSHHHQEQNISGMSLGYGMSMPLNLSSLDSMNAIGGPSSITLGHGMSLSMPMGMDANGDSSSTAAGVIDAGSSVGTGVSESDLGFGFHGRADGGAFGYAGSGSGVGGGEGDQHQHQQQDQQMYASHEQMYQSAPSLGQPQQMQLQPQDHQQQQQQDHQQQQQPPQQSSTSLSARQQRKLEYLEPHPLEDPPRIERDGSMWKTACKLRVWEITRRYTPDTIRTVVAQEAHDYYSAKGVFPLGYNRNRATAAQMRRRRRKRIFSQMAREGSASGGEELDDDEFMSEKIYSFELLDDDDVVEGGEGMAVGGYPYEEEDMYDDEDEDEWDDDEDEDDEEDDEDEQVELALALSKSSSSSPSPKDKEKTTGAEDGGLVSGDDEDAEGEMEVDIEAFSDPSFNAELSSPTSPTSPSAPITSGGGFVASFYIPPVANNGNDSHQVGGFFGSEDGRTDSEGSTSRANSYSPEPQDLTQQEQHSDQDQEEQQQQLQHQHQHPVQIHLPAANQPFYPQPILPLPPPRLDTIRVGYLRQSELGVKMTGRGTPADRFRAAQWSAVWKKPFKRTVFEREADGADAGSVGADDVVEGEEGTSRGRPRLRMSLDGENDDVNDGKDSSMSSVLTPSLPANELPVSRQDSQHSMSFMDHISQLEPLDPSLRLSPSADVASSSISTASIAGTSAGTSTAFGGEQSPWETFLAGLDKETVSTSSPPSASSSMSLPSDGLKQQQLQQHHQQLQIQQQHTHHMHHANVNLISPEVDFSSNAALVNPTFNLGSSVSVFDMTGLGVAGWFSAGSVANGLSDGGAPMTVDGGSSPAGSDLGSEASSQSSGSNVGATSTLSFALG